MIRVGVIRGGVSPEYEISLKTGGEVLNALQTYHQNQYSPKDIFVDRNGLWHFAGRPIEPHELPSRVDVVFNALHGFWGEDGKVQKLLEDLGIPYTGSRPLASAVSMNKTLAKKQFRALGINTPEGIEIEYKPEFGQEHAKNIARDVWLRLAPPWIVKPLSGGSSVGIHVAKSFDALVDAIADNFNQGNDVLVEELISGREATVGVIDNYRGEDRYVLPPIEIVPPPTHEFFDFDAKYTGQSQEIVPGRFSTEEKEELIRLADAIHRGLDLSHYSRSDFMIHPTRGIFAIEVNTLPGLTKTSLLPKAFESVGGTFPEFVGHVVNLAINGK